MDTDFKHPNSLKKNLELIIKPEISSHKIEKKIFDKNNPNDYVDCPSVELDSTDHVSDELNSLNVFQNNIQNVEVVKVHIPNDTTDQGGVQNNLQIKATEEESSTDSSKELMNKISLQNGLDTENASVLLNSKESTDVNHSQDNLQVLQEVEKPLLDHKSDNLAEKSNSQNNFQLPNSEKTLAITIAKELENESREKTDVPIEVTGKSLLSTPKKRPIKNKSKKHTINTNSKASVDHNIYNKGDIFVNSPNNNQGQASKKVSTNIYTDFIVKDSSLSFLKMPLENCPVVEVTNNNKLPQQTDSKADSAANVKSHVCLVCKDRFSSVILLRTHCLTNHLHRKPYTCGLCKEKFNSSYLLKQHILNHYVGQRIFVCTVCKKEFPTSRILNSHSRSHMIAKQKCKLCYKTFPNDGALITHLKSHAHPMHKCNLCGKEFAVRRGLVIHVRIHTGERPYTCEICGQAFRQMSTMKRHYDSHMGVKRFFCDICNRAFTHRKGLTQHKHTHSGMKPFKCEVCQKEFTRKDNLRVHNRLHTGERPFVCKICDEGFYVKCSLETHQKTHQ